MIENFLESESNSLEEFFKEVGMDANQYNNYKSYINKIKERFNGVVSETDYEIKYKNNKCPKMHPDGYFFIDMQKRYFVSHQIKNDSEYFFMKKDNIYSVLLKADYEKGHNIIINLNKKNISMNLDISSLRKEKGISFSTFPLFLLLDEKLVNSKIVKTALRIQKDVHLLDSLYEDKNTKKNNLDIEKTKSVIVQKLFKNSETQMKYTLENMSCQLLLYFYKKFVPMDRDHLGMTIIKSSPLKIYEALQSSKVSKAFVNGLKTGTIKEKGKIYTKVGAILSSRNTLDEISCIRRVTLLIDENSPNMKMRMIHRSQVGFLCLSETSDGKDAGLIKSIAISAVISFPVDDNEILNFLERYKTETQKQKETYLNGFYIGNYSIDYLELKRKFCFVSMTTRSDEKNYIQTIEGRLMRPVFFKKTRKILIDATEYDYYKEDIQEIFDEYMLGFSASLVPFCHHNQAARLVFATNALKQAIENKKPSGWEDTCRYLHGGEMPYCTTNSYNQIIKNNIGVNCIVAIMPYQGLNQEDSIIVCEKVIHKFENTYYKKIHTRKGNNKIDYVIDEDTIIFYDSNKKSFKKIKLPLSEELFSYEIISMCHKDPFGIHEYTSLYLKQIRKLQIGDKIASRQGQKSIISKILSEEEMPKTIDGQIPDLLINPHAFPSRMTVGQLIESSFTKKEEVIDGTIFRKVLINPVEKLFVGMKNKITVGNVFYMALAQQINDKPFSRFDGPRDILSGQPKTGKANEGGLRIGEMELDALISHNAQTVMSNIIEQSDLINIHYCVTCKTNIKPGCTKHQIKILNIPKSLLVMKDFLACLNINMIFD